MDRKAECPHQIEILILDDEPIIVARIKPSLEKIGYKVESFIDSRLALQRLREKNFDLVITDLKMSNVDGMEIFRVAKELNPETAVIIITGYATVETAREALQSGAYDFIAKPFKISQLREIVEKAAFNIREKIPKV